MNAEEIFHQAIEITDPAQRAAYLDRACRGDDPLRAEVQALIDAHERAGDFLEAPPAAGATLNNPTQIDGPGTAIGRYELLELIGEGGMGLVYLAEQKEPVKRRVALKIIKPGMDSKQVIARFEAERQALAVLDHPNIAHVFDAGCTETGRPYFVMEYVKGMSITRYCDDKKLTIEQRLRLFEQVCEGVQHAHQKGIIHRDLKPSNILVTMQGDRPVPKIIDFGIAKATTQSLTDVTVFTYQGQLLGTPEYMSPEQVDFATQDIDTRSDIYSLGVVLYELLAGVLPFESESFTKVGLAEIQRTIREDEPASPSIRLTQMGDKAKGIAESRGTHVVPLARRLHRELEWIPLKAMRKDRCRRYKSASDMADDIRDYLNGNPLIAGPETAVYRVQKFVRRHAGSVATVALVVTAIVLGLVVSTTMYFQAENARQKEMVARTRAEQAEQAESHQRKLVEQKAEDYRRALYANGVQLADAKHREGYSGQVRKLLDSCPEDLRGWEWNRLNYIQDQAIKTLRVRHDALIAMAVAPDGRRIVTGGADDKTVRLWDGATGEELKTLRGHEEVISALAISADGMRVASGSDDKVIKLWDAQTGAELMTLRGHRDSVQGIAFSPNRKQLASGGSDGTLKLWDAETGAEVMTLRPHKGDVFGPAWSPDGSRLASGGGDGAVRLWDVETGAEVMTVRAHTGPVFCLAWSPNGDRIVSGSEDKTIKVWDARTGHALVNIRGHDGLVGALAFSPDGKLITSGGFDSLVKVWGAETGEELRTFRGHDWGVEHVSFTPDGTRLISGTGPCSQNEECTVKTWDMSVDHEAARLIGHHLLVASVAFSPDGKHILTGSWDGTAKIWNVRTMSQTKTWAAKEGVAAGHAIAVEYSPDGKRVASVFRSGTVEVWDVTTGRVLMVLCRGERRQRGLAFSPDGNYLAAGGKVWNAQNGTEVMTLYKAQERVRCVAFSADGKSIASVDEDGTLKLRNVATGDELLTLRRHEDTFARIAFSPDGSQIVSGGDDTTVRIWDRTTGSEMMTLRGHADIVRSVSFSPDGKRILSGSRDGTARLWDAATGMELLTLRAHTMVFSVAFNPDGRTIAAGTLDGSVLLWESGAPAGGYEARKAGAAATKLVEELHQRHGFYRDVVNHLQSDVKLDAEVRGLAMEVANSCRWEDGSKLREETLGIAMSPGKDPANYRMALERATQANGSEPNDPRIVTILGAAHYRLGSYEDALKTLAKSAQMLSDARDEPDPVNVAFTAMTLHRKGRTGEAKAALGQLRELCKEERCVYNVGVQTLLAEAEGLIEGQKP
jgi:WD40 repeat protein/tRNA A-37 threonylcarbamoyl transferase component Bud32